MNNKEIEELLDEILNFKIPEIDSETRFWMIRTQKGYFYNEFIIKKFVAVAWNIITKETVISDQTREIIANQLVVDYRDIQNIKRPTTAINKCISFISEIKENDIILIPSEGSHYITFAKVGEYYEEDYNLDDEKTTIRKIENGEVEINQVSCPYRKRRHIEIIMTLKSEDINPNLYRVISSHHGVSNLDGYARNILSSIYNIYSYQNTVGMVFYVRKTDPISPRLLSEILYGISEYFEKIGIVEEQISAQININSPGPIVLNIAQIFDWVRVNWHIFFGLAIFLGGGSVASAKFPGAINVIKEILLLPEEKRKAKAEAAGKELENLEKTVDLLTKMKESDIPPQELIRSLEIISKNAKKLEMQPIKNNQITNILTETCVEDLPEDESEDE